MKTRILYVVLAIVFGLGLVRVTVTLAEGQAISASPAPDVGCAPSVYTAPVGLVAGGVYTVPDNCWLAVGDIYVNGKPVMVANHNPEGDLTLVRAGDVVSAPWGGSVSPLPTVSFFQRAALEEASGCAGFCPTVAFHRVHTQSNTILTTWHFTWTLEALEDVSGTIQIRFTTSRGPDPYGILTSTQFPIGIELLDATKYALVLPVTCVSVCSTSWYTLPVTYAEVQVLDWGAEILNSPTKFVRGSNYLFKRKYYVVLPLIRK